MAQEKSYLATLNNLTQEFQDQQIKIATLERDIKFAQLQKQITDRTKFSEAVKAIDIELQNELFRITADGISRRVKASQKEADDIRKANEEALKALEGKTTAVPKTASIISPKERADFIKLVEAFRKNVTSDEKERINELIKLSEDYATKIGNATASIVQGLLDGKKPLDILVDGFKRLAVQIAFAVGRAIALKAITKALNIAVPGAGTAANAGASFLSALFGQNGVAAPRINPTSGLQFGAGGIQLQGSVVFTQRGSDLVGVLNNSNARINRVG